MQLHENVGLTIESGSLNYERLQEVHWVEDPPEQVAQDGSHGLQSLLES